MDIRLLPHMRLYARAYGIKNTKSKNYLKIEMKIVQNMQYFKSVEVLRLDLFCGCFYFHFSYCKKKLKDFAVVFSLFIAKKH